MDEPLALKRADKHAKIASGQNRLRPDPLPEQMVFQRCFLVFAQDLMDEWEEEEVFDRRGFPNKFIVSFMGFMKQSCGDCFHCQQSCREKV